MVIGAGISGLAVAYTLQEAGVPVRVLEKANRAGEAWHHRHPQLRLNTHRQLSHLPGQKIPKAAGAFPSRDSIIQYIDNYTKQLRTPIDFGVTVNHIDNKQTNWEIETENGCYISRNVVIATGHDRIPVVPEFKGREKFKGKFIHAADFGDPQSYQGKKVLVIGAGNSGTDILNHLASIETGKLWVSVRHGPVVFPTVLYGIPIQRLSVVLSALPVTVVDKLLLLTERIAFGDLKKLGLNKHSKGGASRLIENGVAPAIDNGFIAALKAGKVEVVDEIQELTESGIELTNGKQIKPDIVIAATGYRTGLESILGHLNVLNEKGAPIVHGAEQLKSYPGLWFTGMQPRLPGFFYMASQTAQEITSAIVDEQKNYDISDSNKTLNSMRD